VREFAIYTALRLMVFVAVLGVVLGVWARLFGGDGGLIWPLLFAFVVSGVISLYLLDRPRLAFARRVQARADKAKTRFDELQAGED
jgi:hypothetical protein